MRLVCPNCSAQYEIDGSMIPDEGRDVQCSNCGHTWFELPGPGGTEAAEIEPDALADDAPEVDEFDAPSAYDLDDDESFEEEVDGVETSRPKSLPENLSRAEFEDVDGETSTGDSLWDEDPEPTEPAEPEPDDDERTSAAIRAVTAAADMPKKDAGGDADDEIEIDPPIATNMTPRRPADAAALDILREEAEREMSQRRMPPSEAMETQTDLGLESIRGQRTPSRALRARMAHLGEEMPEKVEYSPAPKETPTIPSRQAEEAYEEPRRDLLPDIDEINSTLKAAPARQRDPEVVKRSGFRFGFLLMLFLTVAAIFAYAQAPAIARALPDAESSLISYVDWANGLRDWVNGLLGR
ncbi:MAG: zinc-ribbon domain-containing protein [Pseudomonadota bacterium]